MKLKFKLNLQQFGQNQQGLFATTQLAKDGKVLDIDIRGTDANWNLRTDEISNLIDAIVQNGGPLSEDQLKDYARRKGMTETEARSWLSANLL